MKWGLVGFGLFLLVGVVIAFLSIYKASVGGLMKKMGLIESDFSVAVVQDKLKQISLETKSKLACDLPSRVRSSITFLLSSDQKQGTLAFSMGQQRIKCGTAMLGSGDVETGTYEIVKGMGYLNQGYMFVTERAEVDSRVCEGLPGQELNTTVQEILGATSGKVYEIVGEEWRSIAKVKESAEKLCLDQSLRTR